MKETIGEELSTAMMESDGLPLICGGATKQDKSRLKYWGNIWFGGIHVLW